MYNLSRIAEILNSQRGHICRISSRSVHNRIGTPEIRARFFTNEERNELATLWGHNLKNEPGIVLVLKFARYQDMYETWVYGQKALDLMRQMYDKLAPHHQRDIDAIIAAFPQGTRPRGRPKAWTLPIED